MALSHISQLLHPLVHEEHRSLPDLIQHFHVIEAREESDTVVPLKDLRMEPTGEMLVPDGRRLEFTDWSRRQFSQLLGVRWDRWFSPADGEERAEEVNRRLCRRESSIRLRTTLPERLAPGAPSRTLRAMVTPGYSPIADSFVAEALYTSLARIEPDLRIHRVDATDRTTSYVVLIGHAFRGGDSAEVGDVWGGLVVRNSGVGFASLFASLSLIRLLCKNGMTAPLDDAVFIKRAHRGLAHGKLVEAFTSRLSALPSRYRIAGGVLRRSTTVAVRDVESTVHELLEDHRIPLRLTAPVLDAWRREPSPTAFGVSQALTSASQRQSPELRFELERAAGTYLARVTPHASLVH